MKKIKKIAALAAFAICGGLSWAQVRSAQEFKAEMDDYALYWATVSQKYGTDYYTYGMALSDYAKKHEQSILTYLDLIPYSFKIRDSRIAMQYYDKAKSLLPTIPDSEEGKFAKAKYYRLSAEINIYIYNSVKGAEKDAELCAQNNEDLGAQAYYFLGTHYGQELKSKKCLDFYKIAMSMDKDFAYINGTDIGIYSNFCVKGSKNAELAAFFDKFFSAKKSFYYNNLGSSASSAYERNKELEKAVLASMVDRELSLTYSESDADPLVKLLNKNLGKTQGAKACVEFIRKFYDSNEKLTQEDLDSIPENARDFVTVRYMYKMKNSNDIKALREEFESFFQSIGNFYIRLYEKAEKNGDNKSMAEFKKILEDKYYNSNGPNRLLQK